MKFPEDLIAALADCIPGADVSDFANDWPQDANQGAVLDWLYGHLEPQGLMVYEEWKEYFGEPPELRPLAAVDFSSFDNSFLFDALSEIDWDSADPMLALSMPYELPYLEYLNHFLAPRGLRLLTLLPFENAYIFCAHDDDDKIERLGQCLQTFEMEINTHDALDKEQALEYIESLVSDANDDGAISTTESLYEQVASMQGDIRANAEQGEVNAQFLLGTMYASGLGVTQDKQQAIFWLRKAADQGSLGAKQYLDELGSQ